MKRIFLTEKQMENNMKQNEEKEQIIRPLYDYDDNMFSNDLDNNHEIDFDKIDFTKPTPFGHDEFLTKLSSDPDDLDEFSTKHEVNSEINHIQSEMLDKAYYLQGFMEENEYIQEHREEYEFVINNINNIIEDLENIWYQ